MRNIPTDLSAKRSACALATSLPKTSNYTKTGLRLHGRTAESISFGFAAFGVLVAGGSGGGDCRFCCDLGFIVFTTNWRAPAPAPKEEKPTEEPIDLEAEKEKKARGLKRNQSPTHPAAAQVPES
jgi:hypothetical protein